MEVSLFRKVRPIAPEALRALDEEFRSRYSGVSSLHIFSGALRSQPGALRPMIAAVADAGAPRYDADHGHVQAVHS